VKKLTAIDLFAGIGGVRLGLQNAGFEVLFSNDCDRFCKETYESYFHEPLDTRKIEDVGLDEIPYGVDLLAAGFPCQPFSLAGLQKGFDDPRGSLFRTVADIIKDRKPKSFLLENVKNLKAHDGGKTLGFILKVLREELGYFVPEPQILNSSAFGVPQKRERIYIVGFISEVFFQYPSGNAKARLGDILEKRVNDESYFLSQKYLDCLLRHKERHSKRGNGFGLEILDPQGLSNTLVVGNMGRERNLVVDGESEVAFKKNNLGVRKLTIRECARLQGFPDNFQFPVSKTQAYKQLGNTVTVPVIEAVAKQIKSSLRVRINKEINQPIISQYHTY
jgi:DNA (cytosine-5)-methyltransferase 1